MSGDTYQGFTIESGAGRRPDVLNRWAVRWFSVSDKSGEVFTAVVDVSRGYAAGRDMGEVGEAYGTHWLHGLLNLGRFARGGAYERTLTTQWEPWFGDKNLDDDSLRELLLQAARRITAAEDRTGQIHGLDIEGIAAELGINVDRVSGSLAELIRDGLLVPWAETFGNTAQDGACQITGLGIRTLREAERIARRRAVEDTAHAAASFDRSHIGVLNLGRIDQVSGFSVTTEHAAVVEQRRRTLASLQGMTFATPQYRERVVLRVYLAPTRSVSRVRFGDNGRTLVRAARREHFPELSDGDPSVDEMRFLERRIGQDPDLVAQLIVARDGQCHYIEAFPRMTGATPDESVLALSTLLRALNGTLAFGHAALPRLVDYDGDWYCGVLLEHLSMPLRVLFDVHASAPEPRRQREPQLPQLLTVVREQIALERSNAVTTELAKELIEGLGYEGGDAYLDAWLADGGRS
jgi:hypothetical protein